MNHRHRKLQLEMLEMREVCAGNVSVAVVNDVLQITGDGRTNWIEIQQLGGTDQTGRTFLVRGIAFDGAYASDGTPVAGTTATLINGKTLHVTHFTSRDAIRIDMKAAADVVSIGTATTGGSLAELNVDTGNGRDYLAVNKYIFHGTQTGINLVTGFAEEGFGDAVRFINSVVNSQALSIATGGGADSVTLDNLTLGGALSIDTGASNHIDLVTVRSVEIRGVTTVNSGGGNDTIDFDHVDAANTTFNTGAGKDLLTVRWAEFDNFTALLGDSNDTVDFKEEIQVFGETCIDGQGGLDSYRPGNRIDAGRLRLKNM